MSDSGLSNDGIGEDALEQELRLVVHNIVKTGNLEDLTVKRVRLAAEQNLGLADGFYKSEAWRNRSKEIIEYEAANDNNTEVAEAGANTTKTTAAAKRKSPARDAPKKRQKVSQDQKPPIAKTRVDSSSELSELDQELDMSPNLRKPGTSKSVASEQSESELSELIDDDPKPKKPRGKLKASQSAVKKSSRIQKSATKPKKGAADATDPSAEEIKKLQGWLVKCGIRKVWGKELKPYETSKAKIQHLKEMLADVGMTGRFSIEKASRIRETRELQADLEAVQEGAKYWGKSDEDEDRGERRKRLTRPLTVRKRSVEEADNAGSGTDAESEIGQESGDLQRNTRPTRAVIDDDSDE